MTLTTADRELVASMAVEDARSALAQANATTDHATHARLTRFTLARLCDALTILQGNHS